ncbi:type II toxin-antitoxin system VapC family toxin [Acidobacteria bacterium AH-259-A15]|nr:type II toxin-antitoxin system VapC family toxin [Acidobacteria bacterium AH-259-A15]
MARKGKPIVLDSWSVIAYLEGERAAEEVADLIADAQEKDGRLLMSVINLGEVWYIIARATSAPEADHTIVQLTELGIESIDADWSLAREAASLKSRYRMSFADCFAAALAKQQKAELVTGDPEFKQVEEETTLRWI